MIIKGIPFVITKTNSNKQRNSRFLENNNLKEQTEKDICFWNTSLNFSRFKSALAENLARASGGLWEEALNFLDSFCFVFLIKEKNESLSGRTKVTFIDY